MNVKSLLGQYQRLFAALFVSALVAAAPGAWAAADNVVDVWKDASCGCCKDWIAHLQKNGFQVRSHDTGNTNARRRLNMPAQYGSCHTAKIGNYTIEGHVPARDIRRLLKEKPIAVGLSVPAMPIGSPGMDGPEYGGRKDPYDVLLIKQDGSATAYQSYR